MLAYSQTALAGRPCYSHGMQAGNRGVIKRMSRYNQAATPSSPKNPRFVDNGHFRILAFVYIASCVSLNSIYKSSSQYCATLLSFETIDIYVGAIQTLPYPTGEGHWQPRAIGMSYARDINWLNCIVKASVVLSVSFRLIRGGTLMRYFLAEDGRYANT